MKRAVQRKTDPDRAMDVARLQSSVKGAMAREKEQPSLKEHEPLPVDAFTLTMFVPEQTVQEACLSSSFRPIDVHVWALADGTHQLWSCVR